MSTTWLAAASRQSHLAAANGQRRLPLLPAGAPAPRDVTTLPRPVLPGWRASRPVPLDPAEGGGDGR